MTLRRVLPLVLAALVVASVRGADDLSESMRLAGAYVRKFEGQLAFMVGEEDYAQERTLPKASQKRRMQSEIVFTWVGDERVWLWARNPIVVDGAPVPDSKDRFDRIVKDERAGTLARLRALRRENARFNIGEVYRDFNDPTYALLFVDSMVQRRFEFSSAGHEKIGGVATTRVDYVERLRPTIIRDGAADVPATGTVWIAADGAVLRTRLKARVANETMSSERQHVEQVTEAQIDVTYAHDSSSGMWLPARMEERYVRSLEGNGHRPLSGPWGGDSPTLERIRCTAVYSNFRRFETSGRIVEQ